MVVVFIICVPALLLRRPAHEHALRGADAPRMRDTRRPDQASSSASRVKPASEMNTPTSFCSMSERIAGQRFICDTLLDVSTRVGKDRHARTLGDLCPALHHRHAAYDTRVALPRRFRWRDRNLLCRGSPAAASPCRPQRGTPGTIRRLGRPRSGHCRESVLAVDQNGHAVAFRARETWRGIALAERRFLPPLWPRFIVAETLRSTGDLGGLLASVPHPRARPSQLLDRRHSPVFRAGGVVVSHPKPPLSSHPSTFPSQPLGEIDRMGQIDP